MVATTDWTVEPPGFPLTLRLGAEQVASTDNPDSWSSNDLSHSSCLHGAALMTLCASSRPKRGTGVAQNGLSRAGSDVGLVAMRTDDSDMARVVIKRPDGTEEVRYR